eukprot:snap_masked-scaffold_1-processed-gene-16.86-mRNA-1 protein AED:1.00 eAED:1.00 QI:0/0/0/0/1/1/2/0/61
MHPMTVRICENSGLLGYGFFLITDESYNELIVSAGVTSCFPLKDLLPYPRKQVPFACNLRS